MELAMPAALARPLLRPFFAVALRRTNPWWLQRFLLDAVSAVQPLPSGTTVRPGRLGERPAERITAGRAAGPGAVLYVHGGGFTLGSLTTHRALAAHLAAAAGRPVYLLDYRRAPEHPCPAAVHDVVDALDALAAAGEGPVAIGGDSAGGGIALAAAQELTARGGRPAALALLSPWTNPQVRASRARDLVVSREWGFTCADAYLGDGEPDDPRYAPSLGQMAGLPQTYLFAAESELLREQIVELAGALRGAGVDVTYTSSAALWHAAQAQAPLVREAAASVAEAGRFLSDMLDRDTAAVTPRAERPGREPAPRR